MSRQEIPGENRTDAQNTVKKERAADSSLILLIDNYDSFSYNLVQLIGTVLKEQDDGGEIRVIRNDDMTVDEIRTLSPSRIVLSPGPGRPGDAGVCEDVVLELGQDIPILGVCLGHQSICEAYGATITYAKMLMHGKQSAAVLDERHPLFTGLRKYVPVARYHSLAADPESIPDCLQVIAQTKDGEVMAVAHREYPVYGLQFHPESVLTPDGKRMMENFLTL